MSVMFGLLSVSSAENLIPYFSTNPLSVMVSLPCVLPCEER
jgi:hypothetical protein